MVNKKVLSGLFPSLLLSGGYFLLSCVKPSEIQFGQEICFLCGSSQVCYISATRCWRTVHLVNIKELGEFFLAKSFFTNSQHKHSWENYLKHLKNGSSPEINVLTCSSGLHLTLYLNCMCECPHLIWVCWLLDQDWLPNDLWCHKLFTLAAINVSNSAHTSVNTARLKHPTVRAGRKTHLWVEGRLSNIRIQQGSVHVSFLNGDYSLTTIILTVSAAQLKLPFSYKSMKSDARGWTGYYGLSFCTNFLHSWHFYLSILRVTNERIIQRQLLSGSWCIKAFYHVLLKNSQFILSHWSK